MMLNRVGVIAIDETDVSRRRLSVTRATSRTCKADKSHVSGKHVAHACKADKSHMQGRQVARARQTGICYLLAS